MITKTLLDTYVQLLEHHLKAFSPDWLPIEDETTQVELVLAAVVHEAVRLTPDMHRAHALLLDIYHQTPEKLPQLLSALAMNLSQRDELMLRETYGILELTQPQ
jgi:hypothetical protein